MNHFQPAEVGRRYDVTYCLSLFVCVSLFGIYIVSLDVLLLLPIQRDWCTFAKCLLIVKSLIRIYVFCWIDWWWLCWSYAVVPLFPFNDDKLMGSIGARNKKRETNNRTYLLNILSLQNFNNSFFFIESHCWLPCSCMILSIICNLNYVLILLCFFSTKIDKKSGFIEWTMLIV